MITTNKGQGLWLSVDGCEGAGKTTLVGKLQEKFPSLITVPEFSSTHVGKWLEKEVLTKPYTLSPSRLSDALLFLSDYFGMVASIVQPALRENRIVISDRGFLSKIAVQTAILEEDHGDKAQEMLMQLFSLTRRPDFSAVLNTPLPEIRKRIIARCGSCDEERYAMIQRTEALMRRYAELCALPHQFLSAEDAEQTLTSIITHHLNGGCL